MRAPGRSVRRPDPIDCARLIASRAGLLRTRAQDDRVLWVRVLAEQQDSSNQHDSRGRRPRPLASKATRRKRGFRVMICSAICTMLLAGAAIAMPRQTLADRELLEIRSAFRDYHHPLDTVRIQERHDVDARHCMLVARATRLGETASTPLDWRDESFGFFLVEKSTGRLFLTLDILPTRRWLDYEFHISSITQGRVLIAGQGSTYGDQRQCLAYFYDLERHELRKKLFYIPVTFSRIALFHGKLYFFGQGMMSSQEIPPETNVPGLVFELPVQGPDILGSGRLHRQIAGKKLGEFWAIRAEPAALGFASNKSVFSFDGARWHSSADPDSGRYEYNSGSRPSLLPRISLWVRPAVLQENTITIRAEGQEDTHFVIWNDRVSANSHGGEENPGIYEVSDGKTRFYPLPQLGISDLRRWRANLISQNPNIPFRIRLDIGPFQRVGNRIWFGTSFYDGEGITGIGGLGTFDLRTRGFNVDYCSVMAPYSTSSIAIGQGEVWLGLYHCGEGTSSSGGIARYQFASKSWTRYEVPEIANAIYPADGRIYAGTTEGILVLGAGGLTRICFEPSEAGEFQAVLARGRPGARPPKVP